MQLSQADAHHQHHKHAPICAAASTCRALFNVQQRGSLGHSVHDLGIRLFRASAQSPTNNATANAVWSGSSAGISRKHCVAATRLDETEHPTAQAGTGCSILFLPIRPHPASPPSCRCQSRRPRESTPADKSHWAFPRTRFRSPAPAPDRQRAPFGARQFPPASRLVEHLPRDVHCLHALSAILIRPEPTSPGSKITSRTKLGLAVPPFDFPLPDL
ncbi:hypothetical protein QBC47DRAFT_191898 [Echria macrotheca]|uniref:Uncharacterized protein n=1 Tax=Echria macrotheca TaxID=438768 RepID=A0AAJ0BE49_9PEZI|nr:hypothetical protein QBC47DRAFT_191898 [Echria macrotheca]